MMVFYQITIGKEMVNIAKNAFKRYTLGEEIFSSVTHGVGSLLAIGGTSVLLVLAAIYSDAWSVVGCAIFGASLIILYCMSTLYHSITDSGIETDLKNGYDAVMAANTSDYPYIIFSHYSVEISTSTTPATASVNGNIEKTIDYFKDNDCELIAYIGGHCHADWVKVYDDTVVISCLQSGLWTNNPSQDGTTYSHSLRSATESAFSIFTVNKATGKIHCSRFGLGVDRVINYSATNSQTQSTQTIGLVTYPSANSGGGSGSGTTPVS